MKSSKAGEVEGEALASKLRSPNTTVTTSYWRGQFGNHVTHTNGKPRTDVFSMKEINAFPTARVTVNVVSTIKNTGKNKNAISGWWDDTLTRAGV